MRVVAEGAAGGRGDLAASVVDAVDGRLTTGDGAELAGGPDDADTVLGGGWVTELHAATAMPTSSPPPSRVSLRAAGTNTGPGSHATPIRILGCAAGVSQRMIETKSASGIATHPAVAEPSVTCRKKALPAPRVTGKRL